MVSFMKLLPHLHRLLNLLANVITASKSLAPKWFVSRKMYEFFTFIMLAVYFDHLILGAVIVM